MLILTLLVAARVNVVVQLVQMRKCLTLAHFKYASSASLATIIPIFEMPDSTIGYYYQGPNNVTSAEI